jgi:hypothetical protein
MAALAIEVHDMARMHSLLVVPSPRRPPSAKEMAAFVSRLAPIEMAAPSISQVAGSPMIAQAVGRLPAVPEACSNQQAVTVQGWAIPLTYVSCGLVLCLCNILVPDGIVACAHILCPVWTLALAMHALILASDPIWLWLAALVALLLPFVLLVRDLLFVCFYLLVFAGFASGDFWHALQGPPFILLCVCWFGLATGCFLSVLAEHPRAQLSVAAFFALSVAIVSSAARFRKAILRVG